MAGTGGLLQPPQSLPAARLLMHHVCPGPAPPQPPRRGLPWMSTRRSGDESHLAQGGGHLLHPAPPLPPSTDRQHAIRIESNRTGIKEQPTTKVPLKPLVLSVAPSSYSIENRIVIAAISPLPSWPDSLDFHSFSLYIL